MISRREIMRRVPGSLAAAAWGATWATRGGAAQAQAQAQAARNPVACQTNAWQIKPGDFAELLRRAEDLKRLDYVAFECNIRFVQGQFGRAREARAEIEKTGVAFYGSHVGLQLVSKDLDAMVDGVAALGATRFVVSGAGKVLAQDGRLDEKALGEKVDALLRVARRCQRAGLRMVYHNHSSEFVASGAEMEGMLQRTDPELLSLLFDIGHAYREKCDVAAFLTRHHRRIDALHVRDIRDGKPVPLGEGTLDFASLATAIRKTAWPGYLTNEEENLKTSDMQKVEAVLRADRQVIRREFGA